MAWGEGGSRSIKESIAEQGNAKGRGRFDQIKLPRRRRLFPSVLVLRSVEHSDRRKEGRGDLVPALLMNTDSKRLHPLCEKRVERSAWTSDQIRSGETADGSINRSRGRRCRQRTPRLGVSTVLALPAEPVTMTIAFQKYPRGDRREFYIPAWPSSHYHAPRWSGDQRRPRFDRG